MEAWRDKSLAWLKAEFGHDLVYASLHLDEDTPHVHALVAPTYQRKARMPGRRKRRETEEEFEARKEEARADDGVRTVGRASHPTLKLRGSFTLLRTSLALAVADLGIEYGEDRSPDAPPGMSTREWVRQEAVRLRKKEQGLDQRAAELDQREVEIEHEKTIAAELVEAARVEAAEIRAKAEEEAEVQRRRIELERLELTRREAQISRDQAKVDEDRAEARAEGLALGRADAAKEIEDLRSEVRELRSWAERVSATASTYIRTLRDFVRGEVAAEAGLLARARTMLGDGAAFLKGLGELREALDRQARGYRGGRLGELQRAQDAPVLAAYHRAGVDLDQAEESAPEPDETPHMGKPV